MGCLLWGIWRKLTTSLWHITATFSHKQHFVYLPSQWETTLHCYVISHWLATYTKWIILCMYPANERWRYIVTSSLIGWVHTQNDPINSLPVQSIAYSLFMSCVWQAICSPFICSCILYGNSWKWHAYYPLCILAHYNMISLLGTVIVLATH